MDAVSIRAAGDDPVARPRWMLGRFEPYGPRLPAGSALTVTCCRHGVDGLSSWCDEPHCSLIGRATRVPRVLPMQRITHADGGQAPDS